MTTQAIAERDEGARLAALIAAEDEALRLLDAIEAADLIRAGRTEREIEQDIRAMATDVFGIARHWHKRIVRAGVNTLSTAIDNPPIRTVEEDDMVFLDLGPVFEEWEADVGRSYAIGSDPAKRALADALPRQFEAVKRRFDEHPDITGAELYAYACESAEKAGWIFGGKIAGHIVAEFPHARIPGGRQSHQISPENPGRLRDPDPLGRMRHWISEIHLLAPDHTFGGFYERLLDRPAIIARPIAG